jgi:putative ABC transport system permease protein
MSSAMRMVSLRNLGAHKVRLLLTAISVLLGTAFVAGSFIFTDTLHKSFDNIFSSADRGIDAQVVANKSYQAGVPSSLEGRIRALSGVRVVQPVANEPVVLVGPNGKRVDSGGAPSEGGIWTTPENSVRPADGFVSGRPPAGPGEVVVNRGAAKKGHLHTGDSVQVVLPNSAVVHARLVGIYRTDVETGGYVGVRFAEAEALRLLTDGSHLTKLDVAAQPGVSQQELAARIRAVVPADMKVKTGDQVRKDDQSAVQTALGFVSYILLGFGFVALVVGTFIIYNTFSMLVAQRLRELALLRAIGASRSQIRRSVLVEAAIIGTLGSALGLAGGVGLAYGLHALLDVLNVGLPSGALVLSARTVVVTLLAGTVVTVLSANPPSRRAAKIPPVAAMRDEFAAPAASTLWRRTAAGVLVAALGILATVVGAVSGKTSTQASLTGLGLLGIAAGSMLLSPVFARWIITPLGQLVGRPFGTVGRLARTNAVRNPRRTAATSFALTLGLLLVSGIAVIGASFKSSINALFDNNVTADYILSTKVDVNVPIPAANAVAKVPGVASVTQLHNLRVQMDSGDASGGTAVDGPLNAVQRIDVVRGAAAPTAGGMIISTTKSQDPGWSFGSVHRMSTHNGTTVTEKVVGIYKDNQLAGPWLVTGDAYRQLVPRNDWSTFVALVKLTPGADAPTVKAGIEKVTDPYYVIDVQDKAEFKGTVASQVNGLLGLLYGLLGLAIIIAILGIINTLALSVVERRREIGMLRAVGMQRAQVRRTIYLESMLIALFGAVLGLALGLAYGSLFARTLHSQGLDHISVPWGQALLFFVVAGTVGVLAALWPGIRAARTRPLEAIATS